MSYQARITSSGVHLWDEPSSKGNRLTRIGNGAEVNVAENLGEWSRVRYWGMEGYVMNTYLERLPDEFESNTVSVSKEDLRKIYNTIGSWLGLRG